MVWDQTVGLILGLLTSVVSWWVIALWLTPRLKVSSVNRIPQNKEQYPSGYRYRIKIMNRSRLFAVGDLNLQARLVLRGLDKERPEVQTSIYLPVGAETQFPVLTRRCKKHPPEDWERVYTFDIFHMRGNALNRLPEIANAKLGDRTITLHELLEVRPECFVRFAVVGTHARSGFRRTFSRKFVKGDITEGEFRTGSIKLKDN